MPHPSLGFGCGNADEDVKQALVEMGCKLDRSLEEINRKLSLLLVQKGNGSMSTIREAGVAGGLHASDRMCKSDLSSNLKKKTPPATPRLFEEQALQEASGPRVVVKEQPLDSNPSSIGLASSGGFSDLEKDMTLKENLAEVRRQKSLQKLGELVQIDSQFNEKQEAYNKKYESAGILSRLAMVKMEKKEMIIDTVVSCIILSNAAFIGVSADRWNGEINAYLFVDLVFTVFFIGELFIKIRMKGLNGHFCGSDRVSNLFDATLVFCDTAQLLFAFCANEQNKYMMDHGIPSASLFRIIRVIRITRVLRLLRLEMFEDLLKMMEGMLDGITTLAWASVLFLLVSYAMALICAEALGGDSNREKNKKTYELFSTVPRSMMTVFRCSFGDCSTADGQPIPEWIQLQYGTHITIFYCLYLFVVTIGLFNVISAIFVDTTMSRAEDERIRKLNDRFQDETLWATSVCTVMRRLLIQGGFEAELEKCEGRIDASMFDIDLERDVVDKVCRHDQLARQALNALDIDSHDHAKLADILDPDNNGSIGFLELTNGLAQLRGYPRRSDTITIDLMVRSNQEVMRQIQETLKSVYRKVERTEHHLKVSSGLISQPNSRSRSTGLLTSQ